MMKKVLVFDTEEDSKLVSFFTCSCAHAFPEFSSHFIDWQIFGALAEFSLFGRMTRTLSDPGVLRQEVVTRSDL
jgi:hypothetical protein